MSDLSPVLWYDADDNPVFVGCYWGEHFPKWQTPSEHLVVAVPVATWANLPAETQAKFLGFVHEALVGGMVVSPEAQAAILSELRAAGVNIDFTDAPAGKLASWGYHAPTPEMPI